MNRRSAPTARRAWISAAAGVGMLVVATAGALVAGPTGGPLGILAEAASSSATRGLRSLGLGLSLGFPFVAGMIAAVNPCGFAVLPAYVAVQLRGEPRLTPLVSWVQVVAASSIVTGTFVVVFGVVGVVVAGAGGAVVSLFPWAGLATGLVLLVAGALTLSGRGLSVRLGNNLSRRLGRANRRRGLVRHALFGLAYALTSLSCTLPIFLAVVGTALVPRSLVGRGLPLILYALGMGVVVAAVTLTAGALQTRLVSTLRRAGRWPGALSGALLLIAGGYLVFYWLSIGGVLMKLVE